MSDLELVAFTLISMAFIGFMAGAGWRKWQCRGWMDRRCRGDHFNHCPPDCKLKFRHRSIQDQYR